jgi:hypothetical protein
MIKVTIDFRDAKKFDQLLRYIQNNLVYAEAQESVRVLGHHCADKMKEVIETERKNPARPDHKLENSITAETLSTTAGIEVGIGNIAKMTAEAPHWELINDGGQYVTKKTHVVPTTYFADPGSGFVTFKEGSTHIITGIDYVGKAIRNLDQELRTMMEKWGEKFLGGAEQASK